MWPASNAMRYSSHAETVAAARGSEDRSIAARIQAANHLADKTDLAESTGGYEDWLFVFDEWRTKTASVLTTLYDKKDISREFNAVTQTGDHGSARFNFPHKKRALETGLFWLDQLIERVELAVSETPGAIALGSLHPQILAKCRTLYEGGAYAEAVEKSFKLVRDRLRALTTYETGSEAFGKGNLYVSRKPRTPPLSRSLNATSIPNASCRSRSGFAVPRASGSSRRRSRRPWRDGAAGRAATDAGRPRDRAQVSPVARSPDPLQGIGGQRPRRDRRQLDRQVDARRSRPHGWSSGGPVPRRSRR